MTIMPRWENLEGPRRRSVNFITKVPYHLTSGPFSIYYRVLTTVLTTCYFCMTWNSEDSRKEGFGRAELDRMAGKMAVEVPRDRKQVEVLCGS